MSLERAEEARDALIHRLTNLVKAAKLELATKDALLAELTNTNDLLKRRIAGELTELVEEAYREGWFGHVEAFVGQTLDRCWTRSAVRKRLMEGK